MNTNENNDWGFDIFATDGPSETQAKKHEPATDDSITVEAVQIIRFIKTTVGGKRREVVDTIVVSYPKMTYERALKIARHKAKMLGNCMVVEKLERVVDGY